MALTPPVPRDPRRPTITPEQLENAIAEVLAEPTVTLAEEADVLSRAHDIVHQALQ